jgi:hypothetical protein
MFAMLSIALFLFLDVLILGSMTGGASGKIMLGLLLVFGQAYYVIKVSKNTSLAIAVCAAIDVVFIALMLLLPPGILLVFWLGVLALSTVVKVHFALKGISFGKAALALATPLSGGKAYLSNAKGAVVGGFIMLVVSVLLVGYSGRIATTTDWGCAFAGNVAECLQPEATQTRECAAESVDHGSLMFGDLLSSDEDEGAAPCKKPSDEEKAGG